MSARELNSELVRLEEELERLQLRKTAVPGAAVFFLILLALVWPPSVSAALATVAGKLFVAAFLAAMLGGLAWNHGSVSRREPEVRRELEAVQQKLTAIASERLPPRPTEDLPPFQG